ncbi:MAG: MFS transporter, partial [Oscillospiraceae bacterium]|nr:MFS transporter [Oscillospiraceae bacterium]
APIFDSRIKSANTTKAESWLGYFAGLALMFIVYICLGGSYLNQFYTDVLGLSGVFLTWMPAISKVVDAITNIAMGRIIDKTRTRHGKARPYLLLGGPLIILAAFLLYAVPTANPTVQMVWIVVSYNLFFAFAFTIYNMSHTLMVPLSTRNTKQRDTLALLTNAGVNMVPGFLVTIVMPIMINAFGVGKDSQGTWIAMMSVLSCFALPACLLEYYFTKERVTEDAMVAGKDPKEDVVAFKEQVKACFGNKYWRLIMGYALIWQLSTVLSTQSMLYYCNWVLARSVDGGTGLQVLVNVIGQAPLGIGVIILWPLVGKFGKRRVTAIGLVIAVVGCALGLLFSFAAEVNFTLILLALIIKSIGTVPTYVMAAQIAESLDHIEYSNKFRADGCSASIYSVIITVCTGIASSILLGGISALGYQAPTSTVQEIVQNEGVRSFFTFCFFGTPLISAAVSAVIMLFYKVEDEMPQITAGISAFHRAEAEARGEVYVSPEEKARLEQEENDRIAEEDRLKELKAKCDKKGMNFEEEEARYQAKLAEKKAK